jgi:hypothetical protein
MVDLLTFSHRPVRPPVSVSSPMLTTSLPSTVRAQFRWVASPDSEPVPGRWPPPPFLHRRTSVERRIDPISATQWLPA